MPSRTSLTKKRAAMRVLQWRTLLAMAIVAVSSACAAAGTGVTQDPYALTSTERPTRVQLLVQNMNFNDARLFALAPNGRTSIGHVSGKQDEEFELNWPLSSTMRIEIDMVTGPKCTTQEMQVDPGDILELQIASVFSQTADCR